MSLGPSSHESRPTFDNITDIPPDEYIIFEVFFYCLAPNTLQRSKRSRFCFWKDYLPHQRMHTSQLPEVCIVYDIYGPHSITKCGQCSPCILTKLVTSYENRSFQCVLFFDIVGAKELKFPMQNELQQAHDARLPQLLQPALPCASSSSSVLFPLLLPRAWSPGPRAT